MTAPGEVAAKPYKGTSSYQTEDAELFFGRDHDADLLISKILSSRFTLLHAQSGAGKTSLLNARLIPGLEARGWLAVRILPQNDPVESIRVTTGDTILPPLEVERLAVEHAREALASKEASISLGRLLELYDELKPDNPLNRILIAPVTAGTGDERKRISPGKGYSPYFCRLLRSGITIDQFTEHLEAVRQIGAGDAMLAINVTPATPASELLRLVSDSTFRSAWEKTLLGIATPVPGLWPFFENLFNTYGRRRSRFGIVLLLDQFEEIFTRFVDAGPAASAKQTGQPDWRLRWEILDQIKTLYSRQTMAQPTADGETPDTPTYLPLRFVVSMRDEYVARFWAQFDPSRELIQDLEANAYHLALLTVPQAEAAIKEPASRFNYTYAPELYRKLIGQLTKEERYVEPAHLQIVCEKLWVREGRELFGSFAGAASDGGAETPEIGVKPFDEMNGVRGILRSFFQEFLYSKDFDEGERLEILELLERLVTPSRTRNILEREELVRARFRDKVRRAKLLSELVNRTIVRVEPRLGGNFVEITHEFLIEPILEAIATGLAGDPEYMRFRRALSSLELLVPETPSSLAGRRLTAQDFESLDAHAGVIQWDDTAIELMLRSAIVLGCDRRVVRQWLNRFSESKWDEGRVFQGGVPDDETPMTLEQLRAANELRDRVVQSGETACKRILRSELQWASDEEREDIVYWTLKLSDEHTQSARSGE